MNVEGHNCQAALNLVGYQRSGQHGVANWLMANLPSPSVFLNNLGTMGADELWYVNEKRVADVPNKDPVVVVRGLEGCYKRPANSEYPSLFIVRDIKNHMASIIKHLRFFPQWPEFFRIWEEYAQLLDGHIFDGMGQFVPISFPHWFLSSDYRKETFTTIEGFLPAYPLKYTDAGRDDMMASGGGSSFDLENYRGRASQMAVLSRYKDVSLPEIPSHLLELNERLFGDIYENN